MHVIDVSILNMNIKEDADEEDFLTMIIASERTEQWLELIREGRGTKRAVMELLEAMQESAAYAEEARRAGAVGCMTALIKHEGSEEDVVRQVGSPRHGSAHGPDCDFAFRSIHKLNGLLCS